MIGSPRNDGRDLPQKAPVARPDYYLYSRQEIPVRFIEPPDGGLDAEVLNLKTGEFQRALWLISEIYFNPGTSTHIERVSESVFEEHVQRIRETLRSKKD